MGVALESRRTALPTPRGDRSERAWLDSSDCHSKLAPMAARAEDGVLRAQPVHDVPPPHHVFADRKRL
jgi:hypothetical protein